MGISKFSPIKFPDALKQYVSSDGNGSTNGNGSDSEDPTETWDPADWRNPDSEDGFLAKITPSHSGQWLIAAAIGTFTIGFAMWAFKFFPGAYRNPDTLIAAAWPASLLAIYVKGREDGIRKIASDYSELDWSILYLGDTVKVLPGRIEERFGKANNYKFNPLKGRSYGGFRFYWTKLGDLPKDREKVMAKAANEKRGPEDPAYYTLPGSYSSETTNTVLKRVVVTHGDSDEFYDNGTETDMRVNAPQYIDKDTASGMANVLENYDKHIIPALMEEIKTLNVLMDRKDDLIKQESDPRLEEIYAGIDRLMNIAQKNFTGSNSRNTAANSTDREQLMPDSDDGGSNA